MLAKLRAGLLIPILVSIVAMEACDTSNPLREGGKVGSEISMASAFAGDALGLYYLWAEEIAADLARLDPDTCSDPCTVVEEIRYHEDGAEVDHWTTLTSDLEAFKNSVQGVGVSYGYYLSVGRFGSLDGEVFLVVRYVCKDSPAERAGLRRGDVIVSLNGRPVTTDNMYAAVGTTSITLGVTRIERSDDGEVRLGQDLKSVSLSAERIYEDPVFLHKVFEFDGKRVGYLVYNSFDLKSAKVLPQVFKSFKDEGIDELILDLRYNGGGYAFTERVLGSLIAPQANVLAGDVFQTEVYNSSLAEAWEKAGEDTNTYFAQEMEFNDDDGERMTVSVAGANPGIDKLHVIVTGNSASASEGLVVGLIPYLEVDLVGTRTAGKYCAGFMLSPKDIYKATYDTSPIEDWGIYVMVSKYADKFGRNPAIPNGILPNVQCDDNPLDGFQIGDERETMLRAALVAAGWNAPSTMAVQEAPTLRVEPFGCKPPVLLK